MTFIKKKNALSGSYSPNSIPNPRFVELNLQDVFSPRKLKQRFKSCTLKSQYLHLTSGKTRPGKPNRKHSTIVCKI